MKINFTKEHMDSLKELLMDMLFKNETISTKLGVRLNVIELLHTTTINVLNDIRCGLKKKIEQLENIDEWACTEEQQQKLESVKSQDKLINLLIGYKRYSLEQNEQNAKRLTIEKKLEALKESQKTPEEKIKEYEEQLAQLKSI